MMKQYRNKTVWTIMAAMLTLCLLMGSVVYFALSNYMYKDFYQLLEIRANTLANLHFNKDQLSNDQLLMDRLFHEQDYIIPVVGDSVPLKDRADQYTLPIDFLLKIKKSGSAEYNANQFLYKGILYKNNLNQEYIVITGAENQLAKSLNSYLFKVILGAFACAIILAAVLSSILSRSIFKPIKNMTVRVKQISSENLHLRLETEEHYNEAVNELSNTFNLMLNRLATAFEIQNNFISNASHELRTPLTAIMGAADVAMAKRRTPEEYEDTIQIILEEAEKLDNKTKALLSLAQTGFDGKIQKIEQIRIDELVWEAKSLVEKLNKDYRINMDLSLLPDNPKKLKIAGNSQLLQIAITNLITNGCKYSSDKAVVLSIGASDTDVYIIVKDFGIGIPQQELQFIYDPFFRASNTNQYEGYGIGLPLTRNIIKMHNGELIVTSTQNVGTTVQVVLPIHVNK